MRGAFEGNSRLFKRPLHEEAERLHYAADNICILRENNIATLRTLYPETYRNIQTCIHERDTRDPFQYAKDLVASWVFEDTIVALLNRFGLKTQLAGADKHRKILATTSVSASSDCKILEGGYQRAMEIMCDYNGFWAKTGKAHLRDDKYNKMKSAKSLFLGLSLPDRGHEAFFLLDFATPIVANYIASHQPYGGKPAYEVVVSKEMLKPLDFTILVALLKERMVEC